MKEEEKVSKRQLILVGIAVLLTGILLIVKPSHSVFQVNKTINIMDAKVGDFGSFSCQKEGITNLKDCILESNGGVSDIKAKGDPTLNKSAVSQQYYDNLDLSLKPYAVVENGIWAMEDEYGTSYYYRGGYDVVNNNVIFAGFQWKVIRINGDNSIRLIYNGTCPGNVVPCNGIGTNTLGYNCHIPIGAWNTTNYNDAKYVGYMYGGPNGVASTSYAQATQSIKGVSTSSNAKTVLESWYATNLLSQGNSITDKVVDNLFCNDRKPSSTYPMVDYIGGYGSIDTYYAANFRNGLYGVKTSLLCQNAHPSVTLTNDQFTVSQITYNHPTTGSKTVGNGALTYPIGTLTQDEIELAGGSPTGLSNQNFYLYTNIRYLTMSPYRMRSGTAFIIYFGNDAASGNAGGVNGGPNIRPVINLSPTVEISSGDGSLTNPFLIAP